MAREQVHAVTCDRCKKTEYKKEVETKRTESILTLTFNGISVKQDDLCERCMDIVSDVVDTITRKPMKVEAPVEPKKEQPTAQALPGPTAAPIQLGKKEEANAHKPKG